MKNKKELLAKISQNLAPAAAAPVALEPAPTAAPENPETAAIERLKKPAQHSSTDPVTPPVPATGTGKQAAFWLDDEDRALFHEMGMLLYSQGIKPSHNLVLRAAIRMVPRDHRLVEKVRQLMENDGRKLRHQKKATA